MANVILGLLLLRRMSLYDLVRAFETGVSLFYSASSGSIKRALDGLLARELVEVGEAAADDARGRKPYRVTEAGEAAFRAWMLEGEPGSDAETAALSRMYFMGLMSEDEREVIAARVTTWVARDLERLEALSASVERAEVPEGLEEVARFQRATLDYGLAAHRHGLEWLRTSLPR